MAVRGEADRASSSLPLSSSTLSLIRCASWTPPPLPFPSPSPWPSCPPRLHQLLMCESFVTRKARQLPSSSAAAHVIGGPNPQPLCSSGAGTRAGQGKGEGVKGREREGWRKRGRGRGKGGSRVGREGL